MQQQVLPDRGQAKVLRPHESAASPLEGIQGEAPDGGMQQALDWDIADGESPSEEIKQLPFKPRSSICVNTDGWRCQFPLDGSGGSAPDGGVGSPSVDFVISPNTQPQQEPPVVTGARHVPNQSPFLFKIQERGRF